MTESLDKLGELIRSEEDAHLVSSARREAVRRELALWEEAEPPRRSLVLWLKSRRPLWAPVVALGAAFALALIYTTAEDTAALTAQAHRAGRDAETIAVGSWVSAGSAPLDLDFSDGSTFALGPASRARLARLDARGAHVVLESGSLDIAVVHRPAAEWQLSTGPFAVHVLGTKFRVSWNPDRDELTLALAEGQVRLTGCVFGAGRTLLAGETVRASCTTGRFEITSAGAATSASSEAPATDAPATVDPAGAAATDLRGSRGPAASSAQRSSKAGKEPALPDWRDLARRGDYKAAFAAADAEGFEALCARSGSDDLAELADIARYAGQVDKAERAYLDQRARFPGSPKAALAAFALGRMAFDQRGSYGQAAQWFQTYLTESRGGSLSREAHGRWFEALEKSGNHLAARRVAEQYLKQHPNGPHSKLARELVGTRP